MPPQGPKGPDPDQLDWCLAVPRVRINTYGGVEPILAQWTQARIAASAVILATALHVPLQGGWAALLERAALFYPPFADPAYMTIA